MTMSQPKLNPVSAFAGLGLSQQKGGGVAIAERDGLGLATILVRKGRGDALAFRLRERFGIELPGGPRRATGGDVSIAGTGPGAWLAARENGENAFASSLRDAIGDLASVVDQSDGLGVLRVSGPKIREALCKLAFIDLDPRAFRVGDVAATPLGHIGATLWRLHDAADGSAAFEIAIHRSFAASFWADLMEATAEF
jgi:heterotetrameric sarcosine oxidase gamma subunit